MMLPERGASSPISTRRVVVLPAPLRPISATRAPGATASVTPRSTGAPAISAETPSSRNMRRLLDDGADDLALHLWIGQGISAVGPRAAMRPALQTAVRSAKRPDHVHVVLDEHGP